MRRIYHLVARAAWEGTPGPDYSAPSLATEGFIHCSNAEQVAASANRYYAGQNEVLLLEIDVGRLGSSLRDEPSRGSELFPHVYGPLPRDAVIRAHRLQRGSDGLWTFPAPSGS